MKVLNFGSINIDLVFAVPHITAPGETLLSTSLTRGLGGKGANTSVALARAGADVRHFGAIGPDGEDMLARLEAFGVDCSQVQRLPTETGQAIIQVAEDGENAITLLRGANWDMPAEIIPAVLAEADAGDWLVLQNETAHVVEAARRADEAGVQVAYAAAPFEAKAVAEVLPFADLIALNRVEADQMEKALGSNVEELGIAMAIVTDGSKGATLYRAGHEPLFVPARKVEKVVDTTAAGDTFLGFFLGRLSRGEPAERAMDVATAASAIGVTRPGAAGSIPDIEEVLSSL